MSAASTRALRGLAAALALLACVRPARAEDTPIPKWMHHEQKLGSRVVDESRLKPVTNRQDPRFAPEQARTFPVKSYWIDADKLDAFTGAGLPPTLGSLFFREVGGRKQARLLVHPESERFYADVTAGAERAEDLHASATASSRTLLVWPDGKRDHAFFAKLSLDKEIGGVVRTIPRGEVARSIGVNDILHADRAHLPEGFAFLPEQIGLVPKGMARGGMIIRTIPDAALRGEVDYVPLFSLYARPEYGGPPLLARMIAASGQPADEFIRARIVRPFARQWLALAVGRGITTEAHAQNLLVELGKDGLPTGTFLHRDFGGFNVDLAHRAAKRLPAPRLPVAGSLADDYHTSKHGQALDQSLGTYFKGGFLFNLERELPIWKALGWLPSAGEYADGRYTAMLREELATAHQALTGRPVRVGEDLAMARLVGQARTPGLGLRLNATVRQTARGVVSLIRGWRGGKGRASERQTASRR